MFQHGYNNLPLIIQQQNVGERGERRGRYNKTIKVQKGGWRSRKFSKSKGGGGGLEVQELFQLGKGGLKSKRNQTKRERGSKSM
jgi:hypothetical protein